MNSEQKKIFRNNIIKLIIGIILLSFSRSYMTKHPAEKESIFSGFEVLRQRLTVYVHKITNDNPEALQKKYDYEKTYAELVKLAESKECSNPNILTELQETSLKLKKESVKDLDVSLPEYARQANEYKNMIDRCQK